MTPYGSPDDLTDDGAITTLRIVGLDPLIGQPNFPLDHPYVELVYTPLLGASAVLFLRRIALLIDTDRAVDLDATLLASELGLRARDDRPLGRNSPFVKALHRITRSGLARWLGQDRLGIYRRAPALTDDRCAASPNRHAESTTVTSLQTSSSARTAPIPTRDPIPGCVPVTSCPRLQHPVGRAPSRGLAWSSFTPSLSGLRWRQQSRCRGLRRP